VQNTQLRKIDQRIEPPVAGIDLEQALNYVDLDVAGEEFLYEHYTGTRLPYVRGSRPLLEKIAGDVSGGIESRFGRVQALSRYVSEEIPWAGYYRKLTGNRLAAGRGMIEEDIIESGYGWCMEQARVLCGLTQVIGIPSRLVFAGNKVKQHGHVLIEAYLPEGWVGVDQSFNVCFLMDGKPVRAAALRRDPEVRAHFDGIYLTHASRLIEDLGRDLLTTDFRMILADHPIEGFDEIGICNHFIH
jgi:transglutaminase-like putative cysteine protease